MSNKIDQRIVEMSFENHKFEKGISQSKNSLKEFSNILKNTKTSDSFSGLEKSVTSVSGSFSVMEQIGIGALRRIGDAAVTAGVQFVKSLTIDPVMGGFSEYELKMNTIRAIMNSTGDSAENVREKLKTLDDYADKTIFSTKDMFDNLSTFTNAGISLDKATNAMIGIANATAYAGQSTVAAGYAYRNFSDAISNGYMNLMDWRSISRVAKIGTQEFRKEILKTAVELGTLTQAQIDTGEVTTQFENTLQKQWLTADVVTSVLNKYGDATTEVGAKAWLAAQEVRTFSGMMESLKASVGTQFANMSELIFGDLEEAKRNFTYLNEILTTIFADGLKDSNNMLAMVKDAGGVAEAFQTIKNVALALLTPLRAVSKAFDQIFPPKTVSQWLGLIYTIRDFTAQLIISEKTADKIQRTFAGLFAVIDIGWTVVKFLGSAFLEMIQVIIPMGDGVLDVTAYIGDFLVMINRTIKTSGAFQYGLLSIKIAAIIARNALINIIETLSAFGNELWNSDKPLEYIGSLIQRIFGNIVDSVKMGVNWLSGNFLGALSSVSNYIDKVLGKNTSGVLSSILSILKEFIGFIIDKATNGLKGLGDVINDLDLNKIATFATGGVLLLFIAQLTQLTRAMTGVVNTTNTFMTKFSKKLFGTTTKIKDLAFVVGILSASLYVLSQIPYDKLENGLSGLAKAMVIFVGAYAGIQTISVIASKMLKGQAMVKSAFNLVSLAGGLAIMAGALKIISGIDSNVIDKSVDMLGTMMAFLIEYQILYTVISLIPGQGPLSVSLAGMAAGLLGLIGAVVLLNKISDGEINTGIKKIGTILIAIGAIQILFGLAAKIGNGNKLSTSVMGMAGGILALIGVMKLLSVITTSDLSKGIGNLFVIGAVFAGLEVLFGLAGRLGGGKKFKTHMISMSAGILAMLGLIILIGEIDPAKIDNGIKVLAKMAGIIAGIELLTALSARIAGGAKVQKILGSITITLLSFIAVIALLGTMDQSVIDKGISTLAKMVGLIAAIQLVTAVAARASIVIDKSGNIAGKSSMFASLIGATIAIITLTGALALLSMGDQEALRKASTSLAIAAVAVGVMAIGIGVLVKGLSLMAVNLTGLTGIMAVLLPGLVGLGAAILATVVLFKVIESVSDDLTIGWDKIGKFVAGLGIISALVIGITLLGSQLTLLGTTSKFAIIGVVTALLGVGLIIGTFVLLSEIMALLDADILLDGIDKLILVGEGIGRFLGAIVGGFNAEAIIGYGKGLAGFADSVSGIKSSAFDGIGSLAKAMLTLTGASMLDGISRFINSGKNSGEVFGQQLKGLISAFSEISVTDATQTADILAALGPMAGNLKSLAEAAKDIPNSGGFLGGFLGDNDINTFGEQLKGFVNIFVTSLTVEAAQHTSDVLGVLALMANNLKTFAKAASAIPNSGGFLGVFLGNNNINTFGSMLAKFINIFSGIGENPITVEKATYASSIFTAMVPMATNLKSFAIAAQGIPNSGGLSGFLMGNNDLNTFGTKIEELVSIFGSINKPLLNSASDNLVTMSVRMMPALEKFATLTNGLTAIRGTTLTYFAMELKGFVNTLSGVDFTVVQPALKSLAQINESFAAIGSEILVSAITSFENNKTPFQMAIVNFLDTTIKTVNEKQVIISSSFATLFQDAVKESRVSISDFKQLGADLVLGLRDGIKSKKHTAVDAIKDVSKSLEGVTRKTLDVNSPSKIFTEIGGWIPKSLGTGIKNNSKYAILAGITMAEDLEEAIRDTTGIHSISADYSDHIGAFIPPSIAVGIENTKERLLETAKGLGIDTGSMTLEGIKEGITGGEGSITSGINELLGLLTEEKSIKEVAEKLGIDSGELFDGAYADNIKGGATTSAYSGMAKDAFQIFKESIDHRKEYNLISLEEELAEWEHFAKKYSLGSEIRMKADKESTRVKAELDSKSFENSKRWIDEEKYYKRLNLLDELAAWERVQKRYAEGHAYRMQAERELFRLKEEIKKAEYQNSLDWIAEEKYYNRLSLKQELAAWKRVQARYKKFEDNNTKSEERKQAEHEIYRIENEMANKRTEITTKLINDIKKLNDEYDNSLKNRTNALVKAWGLFDKVSKPDEPVTGKQLLANLEGQVIEFSSWEDQLATLGGKGVAGGLMDELEAMGPTSVEQIKALNQLSGSELDRYVMLWQKKHRQAKTQATSELVELRRDTDKQIIQLTNQANIELDAYRVVWQENTTAINTETIKTTSETTSNILTALKNFATSVVTTFKELNGEVTDTVKDENWEATGKAVPMGIARGITLATPFVVTAMKAVTSIMKNIPRGELEINSPSKVGVGIGENYGKSIGSGMSHMLQFVKGSSENLAKTAVDVMAETLGSISDLLDYDYDLEPTIVPVLDMSNIDSGLDKVFGKLRQLGVSDAAIGSADKVGVQEIATVAARQRKVGASNDSPVNNTVNNTDESRVQIVNNYNVRNDNDIRKISRDQKNLLDRYNLARGVTT